MYIDYSELGLAISHRYLVYKLAIIDLYNSLFPWLPYLQFLLIQYSRLFLFFQVRVKVFITWFALFVTSKYISESFHLSCGLDQNYLQVISSIAFSYMSYLEWIKRTFVCSACCIGTSTKDSIIANFESRCCCFRVFLSEVLVGSHFDPRSVGSCPRRSPKTVPFTIS